MQADEPVIQMELSPKNKMPVVKPPWMEELKKNQEKRVGGTVPDSKPPINSTKPTIPKVEATPALPSQPKPIILTDHAPSYGLNNAVKGNSIKSIPPATNSAKNFFKNSSPEPVKLTTPGIIPSTTTTNKSPPNESSYQNSLRRVNNLNGTERSSNFQRKESSAKPDGDVYEEVISLRHRVRDLEDTVQSLHKMLLDLKSSIEENNHVLHLWTRRSHDLTSFNYLTFTTVPFWSPRLWAVSYFYLKYVLITSSSSSFFYIEKNIPVWYEQNLKRCILGLWTNPRCIE